MGSSGEMAMTSLVGGSAAAAAAGVAGSSGVSSGGVSSSASSIRTRSADAELVLAFTVIVENCKNRHDKRKNARDNFILCVQSCELIGEETLSQTFF